MDMQKVLNRIQAVALRAVEQSMGELAEEEGLQRPKTPLGKLVEFASTVTVTDAHAALQILAFLKGACRHSYEDGGHCVLCGAELAKPVEAPGREKPIDEAISPTTDEIQVVSYEDLAWLRRARF